MGTGSEARLNRRSQGWGFSISLYLCSSVFICGSALGQEKADLIVTNGTVVTMDAQRRVIEGGAVAIRGDSIIALGPHAEISAKHAAAKTVDAHGAIVMPGLINGHAHAAMSLFRGIADDFSLDDWLHKYIFPAEAKNVDEEFVMWGTRLDMLEMLRGGITTYADMYYFEDAVARVTKEAGMRGVLGETILDFPAPDNKTREQAFDYTQKFLDHWKGDPLIVAAVAPHSTYTCSEKTLKDSAALARRNGAPILIHIAEGLFEAEQSRAKHGLSPVGYLESIGVLGPDVL
jgi:5-methylthioadenosine/S-adenosylhomocysteine deaminase